MYKYDAVDHKLVRERVAQFRDQTRRFLAGELSGDEFKSLRLMNGLYIQRHAPMLRVAVPYGHVSSTQVRKLAHIARKYDRGYAHVTTRQNIQFNWPALETVPDILDELADVEMHAIQTSGNCVRNTTTDAFAGVAADELLDGRAYCEIIRQWSTLHPEFAYLPRKFKIAVSGSVHDRAATQVHDVGLHVVQNDAGEIGFKVWVGGGLGRTPIVGKLIREFLPARYILTYLDAILRVYNRFGRRDNKYKARIKILVQALTPEAFATKVDEEWSNLKDGPATLRDEDVAHYASFFTDPAYEALTANPDSFTAPLATDAAFAKWVSRNTMAHKKAGYRSVVLSLKKTGVPPGDITDAQLDVAADWADRFGFGELRFSHEQNVILPDIKEADLYDLWQLAKQHGFATPNIGLLTDIICCPGGDFCDLANARSIPVAEAIQRKFDDLDYLFDLGDIDCNFSGCMNACGHHHIGNIGILGVDKNGEEWYQITLGGSQGNQTTIGKVIGPSFAQTDVPLAFEKIMNLYVEQRQDGERFIEMVRRVGLDPFKERVYAKSH